MKKLLLLIGLVVFLTPSLGSADDISDFQIEGMSVGDSLLDYMTEAEIKTEMQNSTEIGKDFLLIYYYYSPSGSKLYDYVTVALKVKDKKYLIHSIRGFLDFPNNIKACLEKKKEIQDEVKGLLIGADITDRKNIKHAGDKSGKSKDWSFDFIIKSGAWIKVACVDWSEELTKKQRWKDALEVGVYSVEYTKYLRKHYN